MVLLGAFLVVNRGNHSLTQNSLKRQQAYNVCMTALHYAWGELELNQGWGAGGFPNGRRDQTPPHRAQIGRDPAWRQGQS